MVSTKKHSIKRVVFLSLMAAILFLGTTIPAFAATFPDVGESNRYYEVVEENYSKGYVKGFDNGNFKPDTLLDRVQGAIIFSRILHLNDNNLTQKFSDVPKDYRFFKEVTSIANRGYINGYGDGTFKLYNPLTRGQVALMIYRTFEKDLKEFKQLDNPLTDVKGTAYETAVTALYSAGATAGFPDKTYRPNNNISRGDFLLLLSNTLKAINANKLVKSLNVKVNNDQTATLYGHIEDKKLNGLELVNIKINNAKGEQVVNVDVKPQSDHSFTYTTNVLALGKYEAKASIVGSSQYKTVEFEIDDKIAPAAPGISFVGKSVVGGVVDLLDLQTDLDTRFTYGTTGVTGAKVGDTLKYKVYSDNAEVLKKEVVLTAQDISNGYVQEVIKTNALQNLLGGLLNLEDLLGGVTGASITAEEVAALENAIAENADTVQAAGLLDILNPVLGPVLGGGTTTDTTATANESNGGLLGLDGLLGGLLGQSGSGDLLGGVLNGVVGLVDGLLGNVVNGVLDGVIKGAEDVTIEVQLIDAAGNESSVTKKVYKFKVTDVISL